jgi:starvation-inducible DNA-binding protein
MANANPLLTDLTKALADYQVLYHKLRGYHWNVRGPSFFTLHAKFEELYGAAAESADSIAERIAALGGRPPSTLKEALALATLTEDANAPNAEDMVRNLAADYEQLGKRLRPLAERAAKAEDIATCNLLHALADAQDKSIWMLRAFLRA